MLPKKYSDKRIHNAGQPLYCVAFIFANIMNIVRTARENKEQVGQFNVRESAQELIVQEVRGQANENVKEWIAFEHPHKNVNNHNSLYSIL